ncbi:carbon-nitrogen hydrolase family protein [Kitasatospora sp. NPDC089509]|uniref:carbon-nitrogen hydrolase family protein n=1 Tax=Kitasatospora sp. NPDC089509 TaxID=3364079 RepID=UPI003812C13A
MPPSTPAPTPASPSVLASASAPSTVAVAIAQPVCAAPGRPDTVAVNVGRHAEAVREAGTRLVVFPELSLTGYDLTAPAVDPADPRLAPLVEACAATGALALVGAPVAEADGRESVATLAVTGEGATVVYRKMRLHGAESDRFAPGEKPFVLELDGLRLGLAVCADAADPTHAAETAALGIDAYVASTLYGPGEAQAERLDGHLRERATAHRVWGVLSTSAGASGEFAETSGRSGIWAPDGTVVAQLGPEPGTLLRFDLPRPAPSARRGGSDTP